MSTLPPPPSEPYPSPSVYPSPSISPPPAAPPSPPAAPEPSLAPTITAPGVAPPTQQAPPAEPVAAPPARRPRGPIVIGVVAAAVVLLLIAALTRPTSGGKSEKLRFSGASLTPVQNFTPQRLHEAMLATPFPTSLLPPGFSFDGQKSPNGKMYAAQGFATPEKTQQHHSVGTAVIALSNGNPSEAFQITFLSFAEPSSAEAYMQEARNAFGAQTPPGQPICGVVSTGLIVGCSVVAENVVVEGRAKSTNGQPIGDVDTAASTTNTLAQTGVTYLHQVKGG
jgi:hypothetical protein